MTTPTVLAHRYRLSHELARGGMGSVWVADDLTTGQPVAVKLMDPEMAQSGEARARFVREAQAASSLRSPHVVEVLDCGIDGRTVFIVMELLRGEDLDTVLRREGRLTTSRLAILIKQVCKALELAHEAGIVHRDLKPGNIFLVPTPGGEIAKVLDFGIAKASGPDVVGHATQTGTLLGSPHYMAPEQARRSKDVDHRSDLWALGVVVFRALTGKLPFPGSEIGDIIVKVCADPVPVPSEIEPEVGAGVDRFIARALSREPDKRFQSARSFSETLARLVGSSVRWDDPAPTSSPSGSAALERSSAPGLPIPSNPVFGAPPLPPARKPSPADSQGTLAPAGQSVRIAPKGIPPLAIAFLALGLGSLSGTLIYLWGPLQTSTSLPAPATPPSAPVLATTSSAAGPPPPATSPSAQEPASPAPSASASASAEPGPTLKPKNTPPRQPKSPLGF